MDTDELEAWAQLLASIRAELVGTSCSLALELNPHGAHHWRGPDGITRLCPGYGSHRE